MPVSTQYFENEVWARNLSVWACVLRIFTASLNGSRYVQKSYGSRDTYKRCAYWKGPFIHARAFSVFEHVYNE